MAVSSSSFALTLIFVFLSTLVVDHVVSQPVLKSDEQESVYRVLESINSDIPWRSLFPDDLCTSAPHGVVCDIFVDEANSNATTETVHITELNFGYVSDYSPNPPCSSKSTINPLLSSFKHLRKLFFYKCFTETRVFLPDISSFRSSLEELVFIENPSLVGSLGGELGNLTSLRRLVLTGTNVSGSISDGFGDLINLEQITISRNGFIGGEVSENLGKLKKLRVLDLSNNGFEGNVPESLGGLTELLKLDLGWNRFSGKIPESLSNLKSLEFLDLSFNSFGNYGVPLFLAEMPRLREVYLSGNLLGGQIPEIWEKLGGIIGIGLSGTGLVGNIPASMGAFLRNLCYLGLDNNTLEGTVPEEFGSLELLNEVNLENNNLSGRLPFSADFAGKVGEKLKLAGNPQLCIDKGLKRSAKISGSLGQLKLCNKPAIPNPVLFNGVSSILHASHLLMFLGFLFIIC
ncbi:LRR receptor-like serine/threonine-protein kinase GSO1 [Cornus florida]|uniref:LRR receptor-like serine/threonine-protein kinase GSO1 n=1 Tax=Cornus florida TaxID=4283 RepID=UPI0028A015F5|nr:LRR receptor-like serine/threonine-protein kinase GSO1 [Cornus florida]